MAIDLFARKGFAGTTTREIAKAAGVTEAIIFRHFATKEALYNAIIDYRFQSADAEAFFVEIADAMERKADEEVFRRISAAMISAFQTEPQFEKLMLHAALEGHEMAMLYHERIMFQVVGKLQEYVVSRLNSGVWKNLRPELILCALGMVKHYAQAKYLFQVKDIGFSDEEAIEGFTRILMDGIRADRRATEGTE